MEENKKFKLVSSNENIVSIINGNEIKYNNDL